jgi:hypothetical protein
MTSLREESFSENDIIDPDWVIRYLLNHLPRENINAELTINAIKKMCKKIKGVRIEFQRTGGLKDCFAIHGLYDNTKKRAIIITICCSSFKKQFTLSPSIYNYLICEVADTLCHESIHRYQDLARYYDGNASNNHDADYYADPDEMFAYAVNIAHNLYRKHGNQALSNLNNIGLIINDDSYLADYYFFMYNTTKFNKLLKMIYQNLESFEQGKIAHRPCV